MRSLQLGTSSWHFDEWRGVFYPDALPKKEYLAYYARQFNTVEVNTSFYALPKATTVQNWLAQVPDGFSFALKFPRAISHEKRLIDCEEETLAYLDILRVLGKAAAPGLLQFPPNFTRARYGRVLANYLDWLATKLDGVRIVVEVRAADLMTAAFATFLAERGMAFSLVDRKGTSDFFGLIEQTEQEKPISDFLPDFTLIRWIGDNRNGPSGNREISAPQDERLALWAERIASLHQSGISLYGYMHNPYEGHSPASVRRLRGFLEGQMDVPIWEPLEVGKGPNQMSLF